MTDNALYTLTRKNVGGGDDWLVIRADTLDILYAADAEAAEHIGKFVNNRAIYTAGTAFPGAQVMPPSLPTPQAPAPTQPFTQSPNSPEVRVDRYNNEWTFGLAYAPLCQHHSEPMLRKKGVSRTGSTYEGWFCRHSYDSKTDCPAQFGK